MKDDKRLKRKVRNSYIVSTISIALVLFLLGSVGYLMTAAMKVTSNLRESLTVTVELKNNLSQEQSEAIAQALSDEELVRTISFLSKKDKLEDREFRKLFDSEIEEVLGENPLLDSYELTLTNLSSDKELLNSFITSVEKMKGVQHVSFPKQMAEQLHTTVNKIRLVLILFGGALLVVSLILLSNTIRLAIFSKRYLINTMKLVGATKWFIIKPFLASSITQGLWAGLIACCLFAGAIYGLNEQIPELLVLAESTQLWMIIGIMLFGGVFISMLFTWIAINKFVNMASNKIYLY